MKKSLLYILPLLAAFVSLPACKDKESYADLLNDENQAVNNYLADFPVIGSVPPDSVLIGLPDVMAANPGLTREECIKLTPYYRMDDNGYVYMQVINPGTPDNKVRNDQVVYFRFTRYNLTFVYKYNRWDASGNASDLGSTTTSFRFGNTTLPSTTQWGEGIQTPLKFLNLDCEVNMIIKSYLGPTEEVASVYPFLYQVRYFPSRI